MPRRCRSDDDSSSEDGSFIRTQKTHYCDKRQCIRCERREHNQCDKCDNYKSVLRKQDNQCQKKQCQNDFVENPCVDKKGRQFVVINIKS
jgi:hypothetical protein